MYSVCRSSGQFRCVNIITGTKDHWRVAVGVSLTIRKLVLLAFRVIIKATRVAEGGGVVDIEIERLREWGQTGLFAAQ